LVSRIKLALGSDDDGFSDGTRNTRIEHVRPAGDIYKCEADGRPAPDMAWLLIHSGDSKAEVVSTHALLNVTPFVRHVDDAATLRCFASNVVAGIRHSQMVDLTGRNYSQR